MNSRKRKSKTGSYSEIFKPAKVFGAPTMPEIKNQFFLMESKEDYDDSGNQLVFNNIGHDGDPGIPDLKTLFVLQTSEPAVQPIIRPVTVRGKEDFKNSYAIEAGPNSLGVAIIMLKEVTENNQVYCNVRFLPDNHLSDLIQNTSSEIIEIAIPNTGIIKLNITLKPSNSGEVLYRTHKTEVNLENTSEAEVAKMKQELEFQIAEYIANILSKVLIPQVNPNPEGHQNAKFTIGLSVDRETVKIVLVSLSLAATGVAFTMRIIGFIGERVRQRRNNNNNAAQPLIPQPAQRVTTLWEGTIQVLGHIGGLLRGAAALI